MNRNKHKALNFNWALAASMGLILVSGYFFVAMAPKLLKVHGQLTNGVFPIEKAQVQLFKKNKLIDESRTDATGLFELHAKSGKYFLKVYSDNGDTTLDITLEKNKDFNINLSIGKAPKAVVPTTDSTRVNPKYKLTEGEVVTSDDHERVYDESELKDVATLSLTMSRKHSDFAKTKEMRSAAPPMGAESAYPISTVAIVAQSGTLTAGELNDFTKFALWTDLSEGSLKAHVSEWQIRPQERYTLLLTNQEGGAVVNAEVSLLDTDGSIIYSTTTNNAGRADLWAQLFAENTSVDDYEISIEYLGNSFTAKDLVSAEKGINHLQVPVSCYNPTEVDIAFVVDATGSMSDEIAYLQAELEDVILDVQENNESLAIRTSSVFYRDHTDEYVTRVSDFSDDLATTTAFINEQSAKGGGDMPEAVDAALEEAVQNFSWSKEARAKLLFLVLDAPPHNDVESVARMKKAVDAASKQGIRIIPIVGSGANKSTEYLMRSIALATGGTYLFLTDHSGVGGSHMAPSTDAYDVTYLNNLMKEVIARYTMASSCHNDNASIVKDHTVIERVKGSEKEHPEKSIPVVELSLENTVLKANDDVSGIASKEKEELDALIDEAEKAEKTIYSLFPNPTSGVLNVFTSTPQQRILLLDMTGKLLREFNSNDQTQFAVNVSEYPPGMYFIGFYADDKMHTERFVLSK